MGTALCTPTNSLIVDAGKSRASAGLLLDKVEDRLKGASGLLQALHAGPLPPNSPLWATVPDARNSTEKGVYVIATNTGQLHSGAYAGITGAIGGFQARIKHHCREPAQTGARLHGDGPGSLHAQPKPTMQAVVVAVQANGDVDQPNEGHSALMCGIEGVIIMLLGSARHRNAMMHRLFNGFAAASGLWPRGHFSNHPAPLNRLMGLDPHSGLCGSLLPLFAALLGDGMRVEIETYPITGTRRARISSATLQVSAQLGMAAFGIVTYDSADQAWTIADPADVATREVTLVANSSLGLRRYSSRIDVFVKEGVLVPLSGEADAVQIPPGLSNHCRVANRVFTFDPNQGYVVKYSSTKGKGGGKIKNNSVAGVAGNLSFSLATDVFQPSLVLDRGEGSWRRKEQSGRAGWKLGKMDCYKAQRLGSRLKQAGCLMPDSGPII